MSIEFHCNHCGKLLRTGDDKAGRSAACPGCGGTITVPGDEEPEWIDALDEELEDDWSESFGGSAAPPHPFPRQPRMRNCPMCGEPIPRRAPRCRFCGEEFDRTGYETPQRGSSALAGASLGTGIGALACTVCCGCFSLPLSITAITLGLLAQAEIKREQKEGRGMAIAGIVCGAVALLLFALMMILAFSQPQFQWNFNVR